MDIKIGQIIRYQKELNETETDIYQDFYTLTKGNQKTGVGTGGKGIFCYAKVSEFGKNFQRIPAFVIHSNPYKEGTEATPWVDIINADEGYAIYNGDNKSSKSEAFSSTGNRGLIKAWPLYQDPSKRIYAPPLVIFKQEFINKKRKGYRSFQGYGIPTNVFVRTQKEAKSTKYFTNLVFEVALLSLDDENDTFSWDWIDKRRTPNISSEESLKYAPKAWRIWVDKGNDSIEGLRRRVTKRYILREKEQKDFTKEEIDILSKIHTFYGTKKTKHHFEGLASAISCRVIGGNIEKGWVTKRSGDKGIDFVNFLKLGEGFGKTGIVVLGQAKCISPKSSVSGRDLARVAARLQRGWIGVFVTTGCYSDNAQEELVEDKYPIVLINGKRLVHEVKILMNMENISLENLLRKYSDWYEDNIQPLPPYRITEWHFSRELSP